MTEQDLKKQNRALKRQLDAHGERIITLERERHEALVTSSELQIQVQKGVDEVASLNERLKDTERTKDMWYAEYSKKQESEKEIHCLLDSLGIPRLVKTDFGDTSLSISSRLTLLMAKIGLPHIMPENKNEWAND